MILFFLYLFILLQTHSRAYTNMPSTQVLAAKTMSLNDRYPVYSVNEVFKHNILLTLAYMQQKSTNQAIDGKTVDKPIHYEFTLHQGQVFAFHDAFLPIYNGKVVETTNAHFNAQEGFTSDGYLIGDGVCHLASLIDYAAQSAGLGVVAPTSHDFANIPGVPKQYGVAIYTTSSQPAASAQQNLYITNTLSQDVTMVFDYHDSILTVSIVKQTS